MYLSASNGVNAIVCFCALYRVKMQEPIHAPTTYLASLTCAHTSDSRAPLKRGKSKSLHTHTFLVELATPGVNLFQPFYTAQSSHLNVHTSSTGQTRLRREPVHLLQQPGHSAARGNRLGERHGGMLQRNCSLHVYNYRFSGECHTWCSMHLLHLSRQRPELVLNCFDKGQR